MGAKQTDDAVDLEKYRERLRKMSDAALIIEGTKCIQRCAAEADSDGSPRTKSLARLQACRDEWRDRHWPKEWEQGRDWKA